MHVCFHCKIYYFFQDWYNLKPSTNWSYLAPLSIIFRYIYPWRSVLLEKTGMPIMACLESPTNFITKCVSMFWVQTNVFSLYSEQQQKRTKVTLYDWLKIGAIVDVCTKFTFCALRKIINYYHYNFMVNKFYNIPLYILLCNYT